MEIYIPLNTACRFQMGDDVIELVAGDLLIVDHQKLHVLRDFTGRELRAMVIRFQPELIMGLSLPSVDYQLLAPFYHQRPGSPWVLRANDPAAQEAHRALAHLLECYFDPAQPQYARMGSKVFFQELLYRLARHFDLPESVLTDHLRRQQRASRMRKVLDYVHKHFAARIAVAEAAALASMSESKFMKAFKQTTGMTWVTYVTQVRLAHAVRLLKQSDRSICEIAATVGFADQSYFDTRFKQHFGITPIQYRNSAPAISSNTRSRAVSGRRVDCETAVRSPLPALDRILQKTNGIPIALAAIG